MLMTLSAGLAQAKGAAEERAFALNIPAMEAESAIKRLARQTGYSVLFKSADVAGIETNAIDGSYTLTDVLPVLFRETGLNGHLTRRGVITIFRKPMNGDSKVTTKNGKSLFWDKMAAALASVLVVHPAASADGTKSPQGGLEEIIVTAQKRETSIQDTPISISAFRSQDITKFGISDVRDLGQLVPNMSVTETSSNSTVVTIGMRGAVTPNPAPYWEPAVGVYLDGVFISKTIGGIFDLIEVERIEVLRGPQGTLYGKNTLSGAVNYITRKPSGELGGKFKAGVGNDNLWTTYGALDFPALETSIGKFSANIAGTIKKRDDLDNNTVDPLNNSTGLSSPNAPSSSGFKSIDSRGAKASLLWDVSDDFSLLYQFSQQKIDEHPPLGQLTDVVLNSSTGPILIGYLTPDDKRANSASNDYSLSEKADSKTHTLHADWHLGEMGFLGDITLKSITAYRDLETDDFNDLDGSPIDLFHFQRLFDYNQTSQEFQLIGSTERTNYVLGLYYFEEEGDVVNPITYFGAFGAPTSLNLYGLDNSSSAIYGQVEYRILPRLAVTVGGRYTKEEKDQYIDRPAFDYTTADSSWTNFTPSLSVAYDIKDDINVYFRASKGWKSGGFNGEATTVESFLAYSGETGQSFRSKLDS
ncbi:MAG: TonB-dependent receptor [Anaerolineae bacterium]|nr:TonB-dependent receptor [Anaerolineae bacterium]